MGLIISEPRAGPGKEILGFVAVSTSILDKDQRRFMSVQRGHILFCVCVGKYFEKEREMHARLHVDILTYMHLQTMNAQISYSIRIYIYD